MTTPAIQNKCQPGPTRRLLDDDAMRDVLYETLPGWSGAPTIAGTVRAARKVVTAEDFQFLDKAPRRHDFRTRLDRLNPLQLPAEDRLSPEQEALASVYSLKRQANR